MQFYIDTSIWIDLYENRKGFAGEPLGEYALELFALIKANNSTLAISDLLIRELEGYYYSDEINGMMKPFEGIIKRITATMEQRKEAKQIANKRKIPPGDVLHALLARDHELLLITRDNDFRKLEDVSAHHKPEEFID